MSDVSDNAPVCHECGSYVPQVEQLQQLYLTQSRQLQAARTQLDRLRKDRTGVDAKLYESALEVAQYWKQLLAPKTRELKGPRVDNTYKRLQGDGTGEPYSVDDLKRAVYGYYCRPFVVDGKRCRSGSKDERHVDLELIMRDPKHVDKGIEMADQDSALDVEMVRDGTSPQFARLCDCGHARADHIPPDLVYKFLVARFGEEEGAKLWMPMSEPCAHPDCDCVFYDTIKTAVDERIDALRRPRTPAPKKPPEQLRLVQDVA